MGSGVKYISRGAAAWGSGVKYISRDKFSGQGQGQGQIYKSKKISGFFPKEGLPLWSFSQFDVRVGVVYG